MAGDEREDPPEIFRIRDTRRRLARELSDPHARGMAFPTKAQENPALKRSLDNPREHLPSGPAAQWELSNVLDRGSFGDTRPEKAEEDARSHAFGYDTRKSHPDLLRTMAPRRPLPSSHNPLVPPSQRTPEELADLERLAERVSGDGGGEEVYGDGEDFDHWRMLRAREFNRWMAKKGRSPRGLSDVEQEYLDVEQRPDVHAAKRRFLEKFYDIGPDVIEYAERYKAGVDRNQLGDPERIESLLSDHINFLREQAGDVDKLPFHNPLEPWHMGMTNPPWYKEDDK